jgi:hypothetical protein
MFEFMEYSYLEGILTAVTIANGLLFLTASIMNAACFYLLETIDV